MITGELKSKIDRIWDTMWSGGISNPLTIIEQLTYLLFIKRLDELHTLKERKVARTGESLEEPTFEACQDHLRWSRFKETAPEKMFTIVSDEVFPFIKTLNSKGGADGESGSTYTHHMRDALFLMPTPRVLANVVDQLDSIDMSDADTKGDLYEYMLGKIASAGQNGQFRTPRHIINLMVELTSPGLKDIICDPACGTAGFLISATEYLRKNYSGEIFRDKESRRQFNEKIFHGYDFDSTMLRIGSMNMLLHGVENPDISYKDSLSQDNLDDAEKYSLILANPPFSGSLDYESTSKDLLQSVKTKKTELLFVALFKRLLKPGGRAAVVVPAGVLESDSKAHVQIRKMLVEEMNLEAVIKLPHWVFKPYASVDTSILLFSKKGVTESVWFYNLENDGFADDAAKNEILGSEIPDVIELWNFEKRGLLSTNKKKHTTISVEKIRQNNYDLCPPMYLSGHQYPSGAELKSLGELFYIKKGSSAASEALSEGEYPFITSSLTPKRSKSYSFEGLAICIPTVSATGHGHASIKTIHLAEGKFDASSITAVLVPKNDDVPIEQIYYYLLAHKDDLLVPLMRGATNKSLNTDRLHGLMVPLIGKEDPMSGSIKDLMELRGEIKKARIRISEMEKLHYDKIEELKEG